MVMQARKGIGTAERAIECFILLSAHFRAPLLFMSGGLVSPISLQHFRSASWSFTFVSIFKSASYGGTLSLYQLLTCVVLIITILALDLAWLSWSRPPSVSRRPSTPAGFKIPWIPILCFYHDLHTSPNACLSSLLTTPKIEQTSFYLPLDHLEWPDSAIRVCRQKMACGSRSISCCFCALHFCRLLAESLSMRSTTDQVS